MNTISHKYRKNDNQIYWIETLFINIANKMLQRLKAIFFPQSRYFSYTKPQCKR